MATFSSYLRFEDCSEQADLRASNSDILDVFLTLQAEPFLTVHILCTEKRLCTNRVKFLLSMRKALLRYGWEPRPNRFSF